MKLALATLTLFAASSLQDAKMDWKKDYSAALSEAKKNNKYLVLHFMGSN